MEQTNMTFPGEMQVDVRLAAGDADVRVLKLEVTSAAEGGREPAPLLWRRARDGVRAFVEGVDAGLWGGEDGDPCEILATTSRERDGLRAEVWEMKTPRIDPEAFGVLAHMLWGADSRSMRLVENAPEDRLTVRALPPPRTVRRTAWQLENLLGDHQKSAVVLVCFAADPPADIVTATHRTLRAWSGVVACGGFSGGDYPFSGAQLLEVAAELESEIFASFDSLRLGADAWGPLWCALRRIHQRAPIARVVMH